ncbi:unnamed protein product [Blepharisma stoltei]|uniref:Uncharacterized protein n=1 Tax=Blepharisma stoltei TaxID=1481888 RepID=A0AAU9K6Q1_9CILI|nr:unnamed protein product [Blepharisma stoltei]
MAELSSKRLFGDESPLRLPSLTLDRAFLTELGKQSKDSNNQDKISEYYSAIKSQISTLDTHIDGVLQRHEQDFLNAFKCQMYNLYAQLKELKKKTDENELKIKRDEQINRLQKSMEWFREEAVKLGESAQFYKKEADKWKAKAESLEDDRKFLETQLKTAKRKIKLLQGESIIKDEIEEPQESFITQKEPIHNESVASIKNYSPVSKYGIVVLDLLQKYSIKDGSFYVEIENYLLNQEKQYNEAIKHYKNTLDNKKKKIQNITAQQTSVFLEKSESESLFLECVEEVRKEVLRRRAKTLLNQKFGKKSKFTERDTKDHFTPGDKRKILELLISNEQVLIMLYEKLFPYRASQFATIPKNEDEEHTDEKLINLDEMLQQIPFKPPEEKPNESFQHKGRNLLTS